MEHNIEKDVLWTPKSGNPCSTCGSHYVEVEDVDEWTVAVRCVGSCQQPAWYRTDIFLEKFKELVH